MPGIPGLRRLAGGYGDSLHMTPSFIASPLGRQLERVVRAATLA